MRSPCSPLPRPARIEPGERTDTGPSVGRLSIPVDRRGSPGLVCGRARLTVRTFPMRLMVIRRVARGPAEEDAAVTGRIVGPAWPWWTIVAPSSTTAPPKEPDFPEID